MEGYVPRRNMISVRNSVRNALKKAPKCMKILDVIPKKEISK